MPSTESANLSQQKWSVYLIRTKHNALYCGITSDIARRFSQHCNGKGAKALRGKGPLSLAWSTSGLTKSDALRLEYQIKQLTKAVKEQLVKGEAITFPIRRKSQCEA
jgi:putative endonuclease